MSYITISTFVSFEHSVVRTFFVLFSYFFRTFFVLFFASVRIIYNTGNPYFNNAEYNSGLGLGIGEGCPCLPLAEDAGSDLEIDCVLNSPSAIRNMWYSMTSDGNKVEGTANEYDGDVNVMENEMLTIVPYRTDRPLVVRRCTSPK